MWPRQSGKLYLQPPAPCLSSRLPQLVQVPGVGSAPVCSLVLLEPKESLLPLRDWHSGKGKGGLEGLFSTFTRKTGREGMPGGQAGHVRLLVW